MKPSLQTSELGLRDYQEVFEAMCLFTDQRSTETADGLWLVEHPPVFTQGLAGKAEHVLDPGTIPVIQSDRGGQVTYHGPGQLVCYVLIDLRRLGIGIRQLVCNLEQGIIKVLEDYGVKANGSREAPGIYVDGAKICSIGLRVRKGCTYHGLAFNIDMDLEPFNRINPCGFQHLKMTQLRELIGPVTLAEVSPKVVKCLSEIFGYSTNENLHATIERPILKTTCSGKISPHSRQD